MKTLLLLILVLISQSSFGNDENPLIGKWVLDKERTIGYASETGTLTDEKKRIWNQSKTVLEFTQTKYILNHGSDTVAGTYEIINATKKQMSIMYNNSPPIETIYFVNSGFYSDSSETENVRKYFKKLE